MVGQISSKCILNYILPSLKYSWPGNHVFYFFPLIAANSSVTVTPGKLL